MIKKTKNGKLLPKMNCLECPHNKKCDTYNFGATIVYKGKRTPFCKYHIYSVVDLMVERYNQENEQMVKGNVMMFPQEEYGRATKTGLLIRSVFWTMWFFLLGRYTMFLKAIKWTKWDFPMSTMRIGFCFACAPLLGWALYLTMGFFGIGVFIIAEFALACVSRD